MVFILFFTIVLLLIIGIQNTVGINYYLVFSKFFSVYLVPGTGRRRHEVPGKLFTSRVQQPFGVGRG